MSKCCRTKHSRMNAWMDVWNYEKGKTISTTSSLIAQSAYASPLSALLLSIGDTTICDKAESRYINHFGKDMYIAPAWKGLLTPSLHACMHAQHSCMLSIPAAFCTVNWVANSSLPGFRKAVINRNEGVPLLIHSSMTKPALVCLQASLL